MGLDIDKAKKELAALQAIIEAEEIRLAAMQPEWKDAEYLHSAVCTLNHTDGCGYEYEAWPTDGIFQRFSTKRDYLAKARKVTEETGMTIEEAVRIFKIVRGY